MCHSTRSTDDETLPVTLFDLPLSLCIARTRPARQHKRSHHLLRQQERHAGSRQRGLGPDRLPQLSGWLHLCFHYYMDDACGHRGRRARECREVRFIILHI